jgi:hypothetical protein
MSDHGQMLKIESSSFACNLLARRLSGEVLGYWFLDKIPRIKIKIIMSHDVNK